MSPVDGGAFAGGSGAAADPDRRRSSLPPATGGARRLPPRIAGRGSARAPGAVLLCDGGDRPRGDRRPWSAGAFRSCRRGALPRARLDDRPSGVVRFSGTTRLGGVFRVWGQPFDAGGCLAFAAACASISTAAVWPAIRGGACCATETSWCSRSAATCRRIAVPLPALRHSRGHRRSCAELLAHRDCEHACAEADDRRASAARTTPLGKTVRTTECVSTGSIVHAW